ncbi:MAG: AAA family ATPase [Desulfocapsaceae bacterium]|nr:AAA family ATPase [Desulfocapsaceae bacterium]
MNGQFPDLKKPALQMVTAGFSVIPTGADKKASISWKPHQCRLMNPAEVNEHFGSAERLAIITGSVSGNLECLDLDAPEVYQPFLDLLEARRPGLAAKLLKRQTPSGGFHLVYRCSSPVGGNLKLACTKDNLVRIETRGEGGYFLSAPSPGYIVIEGSMLDCPILSPEEVQAIHSTAKAFDQRQQQAPLEQNQHSKKSVGDSDRPGDRFKEEHSIAEMLAKYGWREDRKTTGGMGWTRPGKEKGTSGVLLETGNFYCWSANASPLEPEKSYDAFAIFVSYEHGGDFSAAARSLGGGCKTADQQRKEYSSVQQGSAVDQQRKFVPVSIADFLSMEFPPRDQLLAPWLPSQGLTMVFAYRGVGKTHFALGVAYAVSSGGSFLGWQAPAPAGVLYIDGEMPGPVMQERLSAIITSNEKEPAAPFILLTPDLQPEGMPRLDSDEGQAAIEGIITDDIKLIVVDNISTLSGAKENEADGWTPIQEWALRQRSKGRSVLFVHHSGKGGQQRGTSRREDVLDTVIALRRPVDYKPDQGAVFEIHFEKARGIYGDDVQSIEATLSTDDQGRRSWLTRSVEAGNFDRIVQMTNDGMKQGEIAAELNLHKSNVSRHLKKAKAEGLVK